MEASETKEMARPVNWQLARSMVEPIYAGQVLETGEPRLAHADGMAAILRGIRDDDELLAAAYLYSVQVFLKNSDEWIEKSFGTRVLGLCRQLQGLIRLSVQARSKNKEANAASQPEKLRRMLLAMCGDLRVVLLRLASRLQTLRWFAMHPNPEAEIYGAETLQLYSPLANRLGIWQLKWELEDLSLRFTRPEVYESIVKKLDATRSQRIAFVQDCVRKIRALLEKRGIRAEVSGRSKHIYSIWLKMERKHLPFERLFDLRALRIIVDTVAQCYEVLSIINESFSAISSEYDDYIAHPKPNGYRSLHTVVRASNGLPVEIQIRTREMHEFAELGFAAHWRYKEAGNSLGVNSAEEQKVVWLRQLLAWHSDVEPPKAPGVEDEHVYALTPMGRVVELDAGSTPVDFAYMVHTQLGHRCRGAKVNGVMVPLTHKIHTGDTVEIIAAKSGGPSRDWMNPELGFAAMPRTRGKVRAWFNAQQLQEQIERGRDKLDRELARLGRSTFKLELLAKTLGFESVEDLCTTFDKGEISTRAIEAAVAPSEKKAEEAPEPPLRSLQAKPRGRGAGGVLVVGVDSLLTQLARCCHPVPPDEIVGFVSRGRGVVVHRADCPNLKHLMEHSRERLIDVSWGKPPEDAVYPLEILVLARDRIGLIKDVTDIFIRLKINITHVNTQTVKNVARLRFGLEVTGTALLHQALKEILGVKGVISARRC
ncbi:MAG: RelA/SpoT family protein [Mesosutterella sp.]|nr:RelA/SpoT family protein [Mesosutterella sp.]